MRFAAGFPREPALKRLARGQPLAAAIKETRGVEQSAHVCDCNGTIAWWKGIIFNSKLVSKGDGILPRESVSPLS